MTARQAAVELAGGQHAWMDKARCAETYPEVFFPEIGQSAAPARNICAGCEVRDECLEYAFDKGLRHGVFGGLTERQRQEMKGEVAA